ncbi:MAG: FHA domain-containing protein, partial [Planctomycetota bacterium]|nr:FHA domain-containing protein [Planctomycetota bacterium]
MSEWTFRVHVPGEPLQEVEVVDGLTLGRHPESGCVLKDPRISAHHARVLREGDSFLIEDVGSSNKTQIGGGPSLAQGERLKLENGMEIVLGDTRIEVAGPVGIPSTTVEGVVGEPAVDGTVMGSSATSEPASAAPEDPSAAPAPSPGTGAVAAGESGAAPPVPAEPSREMAPDDSSGYMGTVMGIEAPMDELARLEALEVTRPRLVIVNEAFGRIVDIEKDVFLIGRRKKENPDLLIDDSALSGRHAEIKYDGRRFFLTDLNSTNHTYIGDERLAAESPREIKSDTRIRFGSVEAVFFTDKDSEGRD